MKSTSSLYKNTTRDEEELTIIKVQKHETNIIDFSF